MIPRFRYLRDHAFLVGCLAYAFNRVVMKPHIEVTFIQFYFNDLWLIPCALPPVLWLHRLLKLRSHDEPPRVTEIVSHLAFWSVLCEWVGPKFVTHTSGDPRDVIAYSVGAVLAGLWWQRHRWLPYFRSSRHEF